jgi:hypothetical protein
MDVTQLPFNRHIGLEPGEDDSVRGASPARGVARKAGVKTA